MINVSRRQARSLSPSHRPSCISISTRRPFEHCRPHVIQSRPGADYARAAHLDHLQLHRPLVLHVDGDHDVPACFIADRQGHGLEAGSGHSAAWKSHRACADAAECACWRTIRDSIPSIYSRAIWSAWRESAGDSAGGCRMRVVRHSVMDWRHGHPLDARGHLARNRRLCFRKVGVLPRLLAAEHGDCVARR